MENGLSYDFGIQIASGVVEGLVQAVAGAAAITGTVYALISASEELDNTVRKNQIAFGGYVNTMKAIEFSADKLASGKTIFDTKDIMGGMKALQAAGLDARKNFDLINKAANAAGMSFTQMSDMVRSGNFKGLADAGIITDRTAISFEKAGMNAQMATKSVMAFIEQANKKGMFDNTVTSLSSILARFKEFGKLFVQSILGDPKDPNGFMYNVKATLTHMADNFYAALDKIKAVGTAIGHVLLFVWHVVGDFVKRIWGEVKSLFNVSDRTFENFQQKMMSFQLWLEILRVKINSFFDDHKKAIQNVLKVVLLLWGLNLFGKLLSSGYEFIKVVETAGGLLGYIGKLAPGLKIVWSIIELMGQAFMGIIDVLPEILAFFGEFLIPIAAVAAAVYLVYRYWNEVVDVLKWCWKAMVVLSPPLQIVLGVIKVIHDNWAKIVALVKSVLHFFEAVVNIVKVYLVHYIKEFWSWIDKGVSSLGKMLMAFAPIRIIVNAIKDAFEFIGKIWDKISGAFGKALDWAKGFVDSGTAAINKKAAEVQAGDNKTPVGTKGSSAGTPTAAPAKSSAVQKVSYAPDITTTDNGSGAKTMNINSGAVQINVGKDSGLDEVKLAGLVKKILLELNQKGQIRQGQVG